MIPFGLTGDCATHPRVLANGDTLWRKCVWVCVTYVDGTQRCCMVKFKHCNCMNLEDSIHCDLCIKTTKELNDPNQVNEPDLGRCWDEDVVTPGPVQGLQQGGSAEEELSTIQPNPHNEEVVTPRPIQNLEQGSNKEKELNKIRPNIQLDQRSTP